MNKIAQNHVLNSVNPWVSGWLLPMQEFPEMGVPQDRPFQIGFSWIFYFNPTILGYLHLWKPMEIPHI